MNILLTGGTGFIGSYVLMALVQEGHSVTVLARNKQKVPALLSTKNIDVLEIPMTDYAGMAEAVQGKDCCIHVALNYNDASAYDMLQHDTAPSVFLASEAAKAGVSHFIYTSSTAALDNIYSKPNIPTERILITEKQDPQSYYGATKAATENFIMAIGSQTAMKVSIIRPGYTFGNPVIPGAFSQPDSRFRSIVQAAVRGQDIEIIKHDGTQFLWAGDLAQIYIAALHSNQHKKTYFGLSNEFTSWEYIARQAVKIAKSHSKIVLIDKNWSSRPLLFDVSDCKHDFGLEFSPEPHLTNHIEYLVAEAQS